MAQRHGAGEADLRTAQTVSGLGGGAGQPAPRLSADVPDLPAIPSLPALFEKPGADDAAVIDEESDTFVI
ncbi:hypothetical protein ACFSKM_17185 [Ancylobacter dichloromethanicus]|uniref:Uncharacterized protein n=2 Tax=Ancylobacter dichloromethanicus TaxID=518825 RepID=A0A9W6J472_9HYPH|nr:hypothetical protein [Ancylobacter dichloromethanicus]GLK70027.1 hypothetical protein GCM10017643_01420 [Ancylobacter dichloromethanicus]